MNARREGKNQDCREIAHVNPFIRCPAMLRDVSFEHVPVLLVKNQQEYLKSPKVRGSAEPVLSRTRQMDILAPTEWRGFSTKLTTHASSLDIRTQRS